MKLHITLKGSAASGWYSPPKGTHSGEKHRAAGSGKATRGGVKGKPRKAAPKRAVISAAMLSDDKELGQRAVAAVKDVGEKAYGTSTSGFLWEHDNPELHDVTPSTYIAVFEETTGGMERHAIEGKGATAHAGYNMYSTFGYITDFDPSGKVKATKYNPYGSEFASWDDINAFYAKNPSRVLLQYDTIGHSIEVLHPQAYSKSVLASTIVDAKAITNELFTAKLWIEGKPTPKKGAPKPVKGAPKPAVPTTGKLGWSAKRASSMRGRTLKIPGGATGKIEKASVGMEAGKINVTLIVPDGKRELEVARSDIYDFLVY